MVGKLKCAELRTKTKEELTKQLEDFKMELAQLRVAKVTGGSASKLNKIRLVRKNIARTHMVMNQKQKENLRKLYQGKKYKPLDLRPKLTRALRRKLTPQQEALKPRKVMRRLAKYPPQCYAVRA